MSIRWAQQALPMLQLFTWRRKAMTASTVLCLCTLFTAPVMCEDLGTAISSSSPHKRALLIAVSKYNYANHVQADLNSDADVRALESVLESPKYGFSRDDVAVLNKPETTTHAAIISALRDLIAKTKKGDLIYIHYSGHGSLVPDPTEHKLNKMDQTLVPHDYDESLEPPCNEITDRELHALINQLMDRAPLLVTMSFDCCHSGGITRGQHKVRGFKYKAQVGAHASADKKATAPPALAAPSVPPASILVASSRKNLVVLAACRPDQEAEETRDNNLEPMGLFTYALTKALIKAQSQTTYRDIIEQISATMASLSESDQTPQCEGQIDNVVMSGVVLPTQPSIVAQKMPDNRYVLKAGQLQGMTVGSTFDLYPLDTKDFQTARPLAFAKIGATSLTESELTISDKSIDLSQYPRAKAREKSHVYDSSKLRVVLQGFDKQSDDKILSSLRRSEALAVNVAADADNSLKWDIRVRPKAGSKNQLVLERDNNMQLATVPFSSNSSDSASQIEALKKRLEAEVRWRFVKALENGSPSCPFRIEVRIVPIVVTKPDANGYPNEYHDRPASARVDVSNRIRLTDKEWFMIELRNLGEDPAFVQILDLQPDGLIAAVFPDPESNIKVDENKIDPAVDKKWTRLPKPYFFQVDLKPPGGLEIIKVIATAGPTNFGPLFNAQRVRNAASELDPITKLLMMANTGRCRDVPVAVGNWASSSAILDTRSK